MGIAYAWTAPTAQPPNGNTSTPLNVSDEPQTKSGPLRFSQGVTLGNVSSLIPCGENLVGRLISHLTNLVYCDGVEWKELSGTAVVETPQFPSAITVTPLLHTNQNLTKTPSNDAFFAAIGHPIRLRIAVTSDLHSCTWEGTRNGSDFKENLPSIFPHDTSSFHVVSVPPITNNNITPYTSQNLKDHYFYTVTCVSYPTNKEVSTRVAIKLVLYKSIGAGLSTGKFGESFADFLKRRGNGVAGQAVVSNTEILYKGYPHGSSTLHYGYDSPSSPAGTQNGQAMGTYRSCHVNVLENIYPSYFSYHSYEKLEEYLKDNKGKNTPFKMMSQSGNVSKANTCEPQDRNLIETLTASGLSPRACVVKHQGDYGVSYLRCVSLGKYDFQYHQTGGFPSARSASFTYVGEPNSPNSPDVRWLPITHKSTDMIPTISSHRRITGLTSAPTIDIFTPRP